MLSADLMPSTAGSTFLGSRFPSLQATLRVDTVVAPIVQMRELRSAKSREPNQPSIGQEARARIDSPPV